MNDAVISSLMSPVSADNPCGEDLSFSPEFDRVQEARREDDPSLDYGDWTSALKQADWKAVVVECEDMLAQKTKDMRVAAWLTEGLAKISGLAGLRRGLEVQVGLLKQFGRDIHPRGEGGDDERRIGIASWFIQRAAFLLRTLPLTESEAGRFSLLDYDGAVNLQLQRQPDSAAGMDDKVTLDKFSNAVSKTERRHFLEQLVVIEDCKVLVGAFSGQLDHLLGDAAPSPAPLFESVEAVQARLHAICKSLGLAKTDDAASDAVMHRTPGKASPPDSIAGNDLASGEPAARELLPRGVATRADAVEALRQVAAYFRRSEPHSPVAYLAEKALHWSEMPLHLWLRDVVKDPGVLSHLEEMLGATESELPSGS